VTDARGNSVERVTNEAFQNLSEAGATLVRMEIPEVTFPPVMISPPKIEEDSEVESLAVRGSKWQHRARRQRQHRSLVLRQASCHFPSGLNSAHRARITSCCSSECRLRGRWTNLVLIKLYRR
jgi:hypothetical protein